MLTSYTSSNNVECDILRLQFSTVMKASECLFSLVNGDDMYVTFSIISEDGPMAIYVFSRVYLYTFISLFIYFILNIFVSLIITTFETIKVTFVASSTSFPVE